MYTMMTLVDNPVLYSQNLLKENSHQKIGKKKLLELMGVLIKLTEVANTKCMSRIQLYLSIIFQKSRDKKRHNSSHTFSQVSS